MDWSSHREQCEACLREDTLMFLPEKDYWECVWCGVTITTPDLEQVKGDRHDRVSVP